MAAMNNGPAEMHTVTYKEMVETYNAGLLKAQEHISFLYKKLESDEWDDAMNDMVSQLRSMTTLKETAENDRCKALEELASVIEDNHEWDAMRQDRDEFQKASEERAVKIERLEKRIREFIRIDDRIDELNDRRRQERDDARQALNDMTISRDKELLELQGLREKYDALVDDMGRNEEVHHKLHHELQQRFAEVQQTLHRDLDLAHRQHNEVHARCDELNETLTVRTEQVEMLERQRDDARRALNDMTASRERVFADLNTAIDERDLAVARIDLVVDERHRAHDKLANVREDLLRVIAERDKLQESYEIITAERDQARQARDINAGIDSECVELRNRVQWLESRTQTLQRETIDLLGQRNRAQDKMRNAVDALNEQLADVGKQLADCREDRWKWQQEANDYRKRYANVVQMNRSLNSDLRRKKIAKQFAEQVQDGND